MALLVAGTLAGCAGGGGGVPATVDATSTNEAARGGTVTAWRIDGDDETPPDARVVCSPHGGGAGSDAGGTDFWAGVDGNELGVQLDSAGDATSVTYIHEAEDAPPSAFLWETGMPDAPTVTWTDPELSVSGTLTDRATGAAVAIDIELACAAQ